LIVNVFVIRLPAVGAGGIELSACLCVYLSVCTSASILLFTFMSTGRIGIF